MNNLKNSYARQCSPSPQQRYRLPTHSPIPSYSAVRPTRQSSRADNGDFYLYTTEDTRNLPIYHSKDLVNWDFVGTAFTEETRPKWNRRAASGPRHQQNRRQIRALLLQVGVGRRVDLRSWRGYCRPSRGSLHRPRQHVHKQNIGVQNSIDQFYIEDNGHKYLFWGSFHGIWGVELSDDGLSVKPEHRSSASQATSWRAHTYTNAAATTTSSVRQEHAARARRAHTPWSMDARKPLRTLLHQVGRPSARRRLRDNGSRRRPRCRTGTQCRNRDRR